MSLSSRRPWLVLALLLGSCNNDPTCIFTTGCQGGSGAISENAARAPVDGEWVVDGQPSVLEAFPSGPQQAPTTPVVVLFSESMQADSLEDAFELRPVVGGVLGQPVQGVASALVSDGRVLLLFPPPPNGFPAGEYRLLRSTDGTPLDLTGQVLSNSTGQTLVAFTVTATPPAAPKVVATFPRDAAQDQSTTSQLVVVFDRPVQASSVDDGSFAVTVEGAAPVDDPSPQQVNVRLGPTEAPDARAWTWRSVDAQGVFSSLGLDVDVLLTLSPSNDPIREQDGGVVPPTTVQFHTLTFAPPSAAAFLSQPSDAIGLANLTDGDPEELLLELTLDDLATNDSIDLVLFGTQRVEGTEDPPLIALQRSVRLVAATPVTSVTFTREEIALQFSSTPSDVRFEDGPVTFALRTRRGSVVTPLVVLDLDPDPDVIQDPVLDTAAPTVGTLVGSPNTQSFRSEQRDLVLAGTADGVLRSVEVSTPLGDNGAVPPVVGSQATGLFLAAPVPLGQLASGTTTYDFTARDRGLNGSPAASGTFTQLGAVGPGAFAPGDTLSVFVYDARTLLPRSDARVIVHSDLGNGLDFPFHAVTTTQSNGIAAVSTDGAAAAVIVTVEAAGYDLWTLHGVTSGRLSIPLTPARRAPAHATGGMTTRDAAAVALLPGLGRRHDDSRRDVFLPRAFPGTSCGTTADVFTCTHAAADMRDLALGARSFFAGDFTQSEGAFSAGQLLQAFALQLPQPGVPPGIDQPALLELPLLLIDADAPPEEAAEPLPVFTLAVDPAGGVDLARLDTDASVQGEARVSVETRVPGLGGSIAVGLGLSYDLGGNTWHVRAAQPGAVTAAGPLGADGVVDTDVSVRAELLDLDGNASGVRPRLSALQAGGSDPELAALVVPVIQSPAAGAGVGSGAFTVLLRQAIGDDRSEGGLYQLNLEDASGRRWTLWRTDGAGSADVALRVVDPADGGGTGLSSGALSLQAAAWAWADFDPAHFLWSDVEREFELFAHTGPRTVTRP